MSTPTPPSPGPSPAPVARLPLKEKLAASMGGLVGGWAFWTPKSMANQVLNMQLHVNPALISLSFVLFRIIDALTDPLSGWLSDNTRSRWGRRRPWIFVGAILLGLFFPALWAFDRDWGEAGIITWFMIVGSLYYLAMSVWDMPYSSLVMELTPDYHERTSVQAYKAVMTKLWALLGGWLWAITQLPMFADPVTGQPDTLRGMQALALVFAGLIIGFGVLPALFCRERYYATARRGPRAKLLPGLRQTVASQPFRVLSVLIIAMMLANSLTNGFGTYILTYHVYAGDFQQASVMTGWGSTATAVAGFAAVPAFAWLSRRLGKTRTLLVVFGLDFAKSLGVWFFYDPQAPWLYLCMSVLAAPSNTGLWMIVPSMVADVVDEDELVTGSRREGAFTGLFSWAQKISSSVGFGLAGPLLVVTGFEAAKGAEQGEGVILGLKLTLSLAVFLGATIAVVCLASYRISPEQAQRNREELERRRGVIA